MSDPATFIDDVKTRGAEILDLFVQGQVLRDGTTAITLLVLGLRLLRDLKLDDSAIAEILGVAMRVSKGNPLE